MNQGSMKRLRDAVEPSRRISACICLGHRLKMFPERRVQNGSC